MVIAKTARSELFELLEAAAGDRVFPGCVALVWRDGSIVYHEAHGVLATHPAALGADRPVGPDTIYDLASLTKVLCTTTLSALAISQGRMHLDELVPSRFGLASDATLANLLEHTAGLEAHREYFVDVPAGDKARVLDAIAQTAPACPPRVRAIYSDLGFIILGEWLADVFASPLELVFDRHVARALGVGGEWTNALRYRPIGDALISREEAMLIAPTEVYDPTLHSDGAPTWFPVRTADGRRLAHGEVHDDNAFVMGGVAGHAGLFGPATAVLEVAKLWLDGGLGVPVGDWHRFFASSSVPSSTRALGFDRQSPDGSGSTGGALDEGAVGHTGYTGTSLWLDPKARSIYVLLSNRVHPTRENLGIREVRQRFHALASRL